MEDLGILNPLNMEHLAALHYVYMDEINRRLNLWTTAWSGHKMRTVKSSPFILWTSGQLQNPVGITNREINLQEYGLEGYVNLNNPEEGERPIFQPISQLIDEHWQHMMN